MRILFISRYYQPDNGGGISSYVGCIAPALAARGHEVHVLACKARGTHSDILEQGVHVHRRKLSAIPGLSQVNRILRWKDTPQRLQQGFSTFLEYRRLGITFDVIEYPDWFAEGWVFAAIRPRPLVAHLHAGLGILPRFAQLPVNRDVRFATALEYFALRRAHMITAPSYFVVRVHREMAWLPGRDVEVIRFPIDWSQWCNTQPVLDTAPVVLFLGRIERIKAPELLVESISLIRRELPEAKALFVGYSSGHRDGLPYMEWIKQSTAEASACHFAGPVPRHELTRIFSSARVLAMPSHFESYSLAVVEAMASGRPVVVTSKTGVAELVKQTGGGRIVPPEDTKALAEALLPYLKDAAYAAQEGEKARVAVQDLLDPNKIAALRETVYQRAMAEFNHA